LAAAGLRAVVTGGAGFIGSHVTRRLVDAGWSVAVLDDLSGGHRDSLPSAVELIVADVASEDAARQIARVSPDVIVHAAAQSVRAFAHAPIPTRTGASTSWTTR
jgi:UDP-glucose 4-epimerase